MINVLIIVFICFGLYALIVWILTFTAFIRRLTNSKANELDKATEFIKFVFAPLIFPINLLVRFCLWIVHKLSGIFLFLLFPVWTLLFLLFLAVTFSPLLFDFIIGKLGMMGEKILTYNDDLPQYTVRQSRQSWSALQGNFALWLARTPLKRLLSFQGSLQTFNRLGFQDKAIAVLRAQALDPRQNLRLRQRAVQSLGKQDQFDDLLHIVRYRDITPEVARSVVACLEENQKTPEVIQAWSLLGMHHDPAMQLEASQNLIALNQLSLGRGILFRLLKDTKLPELIRIQAAESIGNLGALGTALPFLERGLEQNQDPQVRLSAAVALYRLNRSEAALGVIFSLMNVDLSFEIHKQAIQALTRLQLKRELVLVKANPYLQPEDWREAAYAIETLGEMGTAFVSWLSLARNEKAPPSLRVEALSALGRLGEGKMNEVDSAAFQRIRDYLWRIGSLETNPPAIRFQAAQTLARLGWQNDASALFLILANQPDQDPYIHSQASQALKQLKGPNPILT